MARRVIGGKSGSKRPRTLAKRQKMAYPGLRIVSKRQSRIVGRGS